ncbi:MAG: hypothetical protein ABSE05_15190 [Syntrophales bacterium]|jgi:hypothetical protein
MRYFASALFGLLLIVFCQCASAADLLEQLLLASPWCTFKYNKVTGYSSETRVQFFSNGTYATGKRGEGYSSGRGGTFGSQSDKRSYGLWKVADGVLYFAERGGAPQPVNTKVTRNSKGAPIIIADGVEYYRCK